MHALPVALQAISEQYFQCGDSIYTSVTLHKHKTIVVYFVFQSKVFNIIVRIVSQLHSEKFGRSIGVFK